MYSLVPSGITLDILLYSYMLLNCHKLVSHIFGFKIGKERINRRRAFLFSPEVTGEMLEDGKL